MGSTKVQAAPSPAPRNLGQEYRDTIQAKMELTPDILKLQEEYGDDFTKMDLRQLSNALGGVDGQPGILDIYKQVMPVLSETEAEAQRAQTDSRLKTLEDYGQRATDALLNSDSKKAGLSNRLMDMADSDLTLGHNISHSHARQIAQSLRAGQSARGMALSPNSAIDEAKIMGLESERLYGNRIARAQGILAQRQGLTGDPMLMLTGQPSAAFAAMPAYSGGAQGMGQGPSGFFNPESAYASQMYGQNYQGALQNQALQTQAAMQSASAKSAMIGGIMGGIGSMAGGAFTGIGNAGGWSKFTK